MTNAGILLAAGASRRFGAQNKLLAELHGRPLVTHAAAALAEAECDHLIAVTVDPDVAALLDAFDVVRPETDVPEQADSLRTGIQRAEELGVTRALVVLGDMPFITPSHLSNILDHSVPVATTDGQRRMPPACFPADLFSALTAVEGDTGAQSILRTLPQSSLIQMPPNLLQDIDTPEELAACNNAPGADFWKKS
ncbi:MAG: nucleotidyltransferase family protein [Pseudomonadota bacterium]